MVSYIFFSNQTLNELFIILNNILQKDIIDIHPQNLNTRQIWDMQGPSSPIRLRHKNGFYRTHLSLNL